MAILNIGGVDIPAPSSLKTGIMDISDAGRNAKGDMIIDRIATKRKLSLNWGVLNASDLSKILNAVSPVFFSVRYLDTEDNIYKTGTFYSGDRNVDTISFNNGIPTYKNLTFDLIER